MIMVCSLEAVAIFRATKGTNNVLLVMVVMMIMMVWMLCADAWCMVSSSCSTSSFEYIIITTTRNKKTTIVFEVPLLLSSPVNVHWYSFLLLFCIKLSKNKQQERNFQPIVFISATWRIACIQCMPVSTWKWIVYFPEKNRFLGIYFLFWFVGHFFFIYFFLELFIF